MKNNSTIWSRRESIVRILMRALAIFGLVVMANRLHPADASTADTAGTFRKAQPQYHVVEIGAAKGALAPYAVCASSDLRYVGGFLINGGELFPPFLWTAGKVTELPGVDGCVRAVNRAGIAAGYERITIDDEEAVYWKSGEVHRLFPAGDLGMVTAIDEAGTMYGSNRILNGENYDCTRGFIRYSNGHVEYVDKTPSRFSFISSANDRGQASVNLTGKDTDFVVSAAIYEGKKLQKLPSPRRGQSCYAWAINSSGTIVGCTATNKGYLPVMWKKRAVSLLPFPKNSSGFATSVNAKDEVVGYIEDKYHRRIHAFLIREGKLYFLDTMIDNPNITLLDTHYINDEGHIVAVGTIKGDKAPHSFLLKPVAQRRESNSR